MALGGRDRRRLILCNVASGRFDGFWEFNLNPWDTAAGVLIVEEAGGKVTDFSGGPFQIASRETLASNGLGARRSLHEFQEIFAGRGLEELPSPVAYAKERRLLSPIRNGSKYRRDAFPRLRTSVTITRVGSSLLSLIARSRNVPTKCVCRAASYFSPKTRT